MSVCGSRCGSADFTSRCLPGLVKRQGKDWGTTACDWRDARLWAASKGLKSGLCARGAKRRRCPVAGATNGRLQEAHPSSHA